MSVSSAFEVFTESLDQRTPEVDVLVAAGSALATEIDDKGKTRTASAAVTALRGLVDDLITKGRSVVADPDEEGEGWITPTVPAVIDLAPVRDAKKSNARNTRSRAGGGGATAG